MDQELLKFINYFKTPIRVVEVDSQQRPVFCAFNDAAYLDAGLCHDEIVGRTAFEIYPGVSGEIAYDRHLRVIETGQALTFDLEEEAQGDLRWLRVTLAPVITDEGKVARIFCTQIDVTAERRMQFVESDAEARIREMEQYLALAAHDLRTPMINVRLIAEFLKEGFKDLGDGKLQMIENLEIISDKAMSLISDVLAHAQATTRRESKTEIFQLQELCSNLISVLDPIGKSTVVSDTVAIAADKVAVQIAVGNLIDNALKHNGGKGLQMSVTVRQKSADFVEIRVADNGKGFRDPAITFIDTGVITSNSGFGLIGVSRLVRERGGDIHAESGCDTGGAAISFSMPGTLLRAKPDLAMAVGQ
jgi:PAS domain S-box-containing protein